jgi:hypothetical protein
MANNDKSPFSPKVDESKATLKHMYQKGGDGNLSALRQAQAKNTQVLPAHGQHVNRASDRGRRGR